MTKRREIERLKKLLVDAHTEREAALAEVARLRRLNTAHRVTEPHVDRYFNGGDDVAVLVEHTGPYRSNVTFGALS